eukprot:g5456.t1
MDCKLDDSNDTKRNGCACSRMSYILSTYTPGPHAGIETLSTICHWWDLIKEFGKDEKKAKEYFQSCVAMSRTMQSSAYYSPNGWVGAQSSCCALFAPGSFRFETAKLRGIEERNPVRSHSSHREEKRLWVPPGFHSKKKEA